MPEKMQKTRNRSNYPWLKNCPRTIKDLPKSKLAIFHQFLDSANFVYIACQWNKILPKNDLIDTLWEYNDLI